MWTWTNYLISASISSFVKLGQWIYTSIGEWLTKLQYTEVTRSCPTPCDPMDYRLPGSSVHGIFQARILEWVAISFSRESSQPRDRIWSPTLQADSLPSEPPGKPNCSISMEYCWALKGNELSSRKKHRGTLIRYHDEKEGKLKGYILCDFNHMTF